LLPIGIPLGMPLPIGLRLASVLFPGSIPSLWAINGVASVLGSVLAIVLALRLGFTAALVAGAVAYGGVIILATRLSMHASGLALSGLPQARRRG
jgi:hypothetical protein